MKTEKPLFIPLKAEYFDAFRDGSKHTEYRAYGPRWNERTCIPGRQVVLSKGYGKRERLAGIVVSFRARTIDGLEHDARESFIKCYGAQVGDVATILIRIDRAERKRMKLNLGSNDDLKPGWLNVDMAPPADCMADLRLLWPWPDSSVEAVHASHIFEHLPDRIQTMNELWRVLIPGGTATIEVPSASHGSGFAQDPTHCSAWCMNSFLYYEDGAAERERFARAYGIQARFRIVKLTEWMYQHGREQVWIVSAVIQAVK